MVARLCRFKSCHPHQKNDNLRQKVVVFLSKTEGLGTELHRRCVCNQSACGLYGITAAGVWGCGERKLFTNGKFCVIINTAEALTNTFACKTGSVSMHKRKCLLNHNPVGRKLRFLCDIINTAEALTNTFACKTGSVSMHKRKCLLNHNPGGTKTAFSLRYNKHSGSIDKYLRLQNRLDVNAQKKMFIESQPRGGRKLRFLCDIIIVIFWRYKAFLFACFRRKE